MAPDPVDHLYDLPPGEFTSARDALAKEMRAAGDREAATAVKALRRPSAAAWAINCAAREDPGALRALLDAGDGLRRAQERLLAGKGDRSELREAGERERAAIAGMVAAAGAAAREAGQPLSAASEARVHETLHAAALDDDVRTALAAGRLEREAEAATFAGSPGAADRAKAPAKRTEPAPHKLAPKDRAAEKQAAERARKAREAAKHALADASRAAREAERVAETATRRLDRARTTTADARERLAAAEEHEAAGLEACEAAQRELRAAKGAAAAAQAALDRLD